MNPAGPRWGATLALLAGGLVAAGLVCVDDGFARRYRACDLREGASCVSDRSTVGPSDVGLLRWRAGVDLELSLGPVEPGDVVKLKLCSPEGPQRVALTVDGAPVADLAVGTPWMQHEVVTPRGGCRIGLRRYDPAGHGVDISRLSVANTVGHASGVFELAVRSRLAEPILRRVDPHSRAVVLTLPALLVALLFALDRRRGQTWSTSCRRAVEALAPPSALLALAAGLAQVSPWVLTFPGRTYLHMVLLPAAAAIAFRDRAALVARLRGVASLQAWPRLRTHAAKALQPDGWSLGTARAVAALAVTLFALAALLLLPRSPFEWDEVLFLRAMDRFDVAQHSPHPPGYPVYMAAAHAVDVLVADPTRSLQLVSVVGAVLALLALGLALRRLSAPRASVAVAGALLATTPAFAFHANVGMSDALATGLATLALWACATTVAARPGSWWLVATAGVAALALGTRPQVGALLVGPGLWVIASAVRSRRWLPLAAATGTGLAVTAACWVPVVAITGWSRYLATIEDNMAWIARNEVLGHLPGAPLGLVLDAWFVRPFGSATLALPFWVLVVVGGVAWWRSDHRRVATLAALGAGGYLIAAAFRLQLEASVRYALPALPCLAMLAGGVVTLRRPVARFGLTAAAALLALLQVVWAAPAYLLRSREVAPVWAALGWVGANIDPATTQVVFATVVRPHTEYLLSGRGVVALEENQPGVPDLPGPRVWLVGPLGRLHGEHLVHREAWRSGRLRRLTRSRYFDCGVAQRGGSPPALVGGPLPAGPWRLAATRTLCLATTEGSCTVRVEPSQGTVAVLRRGLPLVSVAAGAVAEVPLAPGEQGALQLLPVDSDVTLSTALLPSGLARGLEPDRCVPSAAHAVGPGGEVWTSDLELVNTDDLPASCRLTLLTNERDPTSPLLAVLPLPPRSVLRLRDVVRLLYGSSGAGAVAVDTDRPGVQVRSTMHRTTPDGGSHSVDIPLATPAGMLDLRHPGEVSLPGSGRPSGSRVNLGVVNPTDIPAVVVVRLGGNARSGTEPRRLQVEPRSYRVVGLGSIDHSGRLEVAVETAAARVLAHVSVIDDGSERWLFVPVARAPSGR